MTDRSDKISVKTITVGAPISIPNNRGDTWSPAWTRDGSLYSPLDDGDGFNSERNGNVVFSRIIGDQADKLAGERVNAMLDYGKANEKGPDGCSWKSSGCLALGGVLYLVVARHMYGEESEDANKRQTAQNASIIKSTDGGKSWTRSAKENYDHPMFPGSKFATPYFINFGQEGHEAVADQSDLYVYAISNNGFWDNGDSMILGRVLRSKIGNLAAADWEFFQGGGANNADWTSAVDEAQPILDHKGRLGMTGAVYLQEHQCYLLIGWHYPMGGGKIPGACEETIWNFYAGSHPWGPWREIASHSFKPEGYYGPQVCPKFTSADGSKMWIFTAGNWNNDAVYRLTTVPIVIK